MSQPVERSILTHFAALKDPRQCAKVLYPLTEILLLALAATVAGADDFVEVTLWGEQHRPSSAALSHMRPVSRAMTRCAMCPRPSIRTCSGCA